MGASENLTITINGKEYVSKEAQKAGKGIENLEKKSKGLGETTKKLKVGALAFVAALVAVQKIVSKMTDAYGKQEGAELKLEAAIKATGKAAGLSKFEMTSFATELSRMTGIADEAIIEAQAVMATFTQIGEDVFPSAMEAAADMSAMFGQDLQSSVVQLGKALNDPIAGIGALSRVGVQFTTDQKDMIKTLTEAGDVMGAQNIILGEMERQFGGTAEAMGGGWTQSVEKLSNAFGDLAELGGQAITEFLKPGVEWLTKMAEKAYDAKVNAAALEKYWSDGAQTQTDLESAYAATITKLEEQKTVLEELKKANEEGERTRGSTGGRLAEREAEIEALEKEIASMQLWVDSLREVEAAKDAVYQADLEAQELRQQVNDTIAQIMEENLTAEDKERQKIQERIDLLAQYRNEQEKGSAEYLRIQKIISDLVKAREDLVKGAKDENKQLTLIQKIEKDVQDEMKRQLEAKDAIKQIDQEIMQAMQIGDSEWLERLQKIREELGLIAGEKGDAVDSDFSGSGGGGGGGKSAEQEALEQAIADYEAELERRESAVIDTLTGQLEGFGGAISSAVMEFGAFGLLLVAMNEILAGFFQVVGPLIEEVLQPISLFLREIGAMLGTMIQPMLEALAPIVAVVLEALTTVGKSLLIGMAPIIQIVTELLVMLSPVIEGIGYVIGKLGEGFLWIYNNVIRHVGNGIMTIFNVVYNAIVAVANGFITIYNKLVRSSKELSSIAYRDAKAGWAAAISADSLTSMGSAAAVASYDADYGGAYGGASGAYGGGTSVQKPSDIFITQNFNAPLVGAGGIEEVGGFIVDAIQEYTGAGGVVTFLEA